MATRPLTGAIARGKPAVVSLEEATRRLARSAAYDGVANVSAAYGFFVDDMNSAGWAGVMAKNGFKETPFQGYHIGKREEHFQGGTGEPTPWPAILPMWLDYTNPVSGRRPENFQDNCAICGLRPDLRLDRNGYQEPRDAPEANRTP